eukprot:PhF_6_TR34193/c0_g1_i1/m.50103
MLTLKEFPSEIYQVNLMSCVFDDVGNLIYHGPRPQIGISTGVTHINNGGLHKVRYGGDNVSKAVELCSLAIPGEIVINEHCYTSLMESKTSGGELLNFNYPLQIPKVGGGCGSSGGNLYGSPPCDVPELGVSQATTTSITKRVICSKVLLPRFQWVLKQRCINKVRNTEEDLLSSADDAFVGVSEGRIDSFHSFG